MEANLFHFANPYWFLGLAIIPLIWVLYGSYYQNNANIKDLEKFADKHLIPHLLKSSKTGQISIWRSLMLGSFLWICLMAAMAGARWDYREAFSYSQDKTLIVLLDLSKSMDADDIKPSRIARARQEIEDIINANNGGLKIGLVGFAASAHMISPITEDMENIRRFLPLLGTDLVYVQGSNLTPALKVSKQMLSVEPGSNKSILIISDGGFQDSDLMPVISDLTNVGVTIHTLGVATNAGITFTGLDGMPIKRNNQIVVSKLEKEKLQSISNAAGGKYFDSHYSNDNAQNLLQIIENQSYGTGEQGANVQHWEERFYIFLFPLLVVILLWFRKGFTFPIILLILLTPVHNAQAINEIDKLFLNKEQFAKKAFEEIDDVDTALATFDDPYKRGVAYYKAGKFKKAEKEFRRNKRKEVHESSLYNLANTLAHQEKFDDAIDTYKQLLAENPNHQKTKHNMGIVQMMIVVMEEEDKDERKKKQNDDDADRPGRGGGGGDDDDDEDGEEDESGEDSEGDDEADEDKGDSSGEDGGDEGDVGDGDDGAPSEAEIDQMLDLISNDHKNFLKNQFYIESYNSNTKQVSDPW